mgnify:CR=1 FL=1
MNLEEKAVEYDYNFSDLFVPLKGMRHLPRIFRVEDPVTRYYEAGINAILASGQIVMYFELYNLLK